MKVDCLSQRTASPRTCQLTQIPAQYQYTAYC